MPGHFTLHDIDGQVRDNGEWKELEAINTIDDGMDFADLIEPVKVVHGVFFDTNGDGDVWVEFTFGHADIIDNPIRIRSFFLGSNNDNIDVETASTRYARSSDETQYLWDEADSISDLSTGTACSDSITERFGEWRSMYEEYTEFDNTDRIFACNVGSDRILCTPVRYDAPNRIDNTSTAGADIASLWHIQNFKTLSNDPAILYPSDNVEEKVSISECMVDRDTITFWVKWADMNLTIPNNDISFHFRFAFHSNIGDVEHSYPYYVLPPQSSLVESLSEQSIDEFYPRNTHWMFSEWVKSYDIDRAGTGRMTRSKIKGTDYVFNSGVFGFSRRSAKNMSLRFLYAALGGGILTHMALSSPTIWQRLLSIVGFILLVFLVYLTFLPRTTPIVELMTRVEQRLLKAWDWLLAQK